MGIKKKDISSDLKLMVKKLWSYNNTNYQDLISYGLKRYIFYTNPKNNYKVKQIFLGNYIKWDH